jgi:hypothetical protein
MIFRFNMLRANLVAASARVAYRRAGGPAATFWVVSQFENLMIETVGVYGRLARNSYNSSTLHRYD